MSEKSEERVLSKSQMLNASTSVKKKSPENSQVFQSKSLVTLVMEITMELGEFILDWWSLKMLNEGDKSNASCIEFLFGAICEEGI